MFLNKDGAIYFPIAISIEVILLFGLGAFVAQKISGDVLFAIWCAQFFVLTLWSAKVLFAVKSKFYKWFWLPIIVALLVFNTVMLYRFEF